MKKKYYGGETLDYSYMIWSIVIFVENRLQGELNLEDLMKETGFSLAHLREVFAKKTGQSLAKYILSRKIANAAFDLLHYDEAIIQVAMNYGFTNPDTFTRAFHRIIGCNPSEFRKIRPVMRRIKLCPGVYGMGLPLKHGGNNVE